MTAAGWIFLICSLTFVWSLVGWCYHRILSAPDEVPEEVQDFRSA